MNKNKLILGAIAGDVIGSVFEFNNVKTTDFDLFCPKSTFTDDTVLTVATMDAILNKKDYAKTYKEYGLKYPNRGYGNRFQQWLNSKSLEPYNSYGNGSAMRVSPIGWSHKISFNESIGCMSWQADKLEEKAIKSAICTHNHEEGIKGACAVTIAVFAIKGMTKKKLKKYIKDWYGYNLNRKLDDIRLTYKFNETCQGSVPEAIIAFLESDNFEHAIRLAISIGGDSDTIACITGGIAEAYYKEIPEYIIDNVLERLPQEFIDTIEKFSKKYSTKE